MVSFSSVFPVTHVFKTLNTLNIYIDNLFPAQKSNNTMLQINKTLPWCFWTSLVFYHLTFHVLHVSGSDLTKQCCHLATYYVQPCCGVTRPTGAGLWACPLELAAIVILNTVFCISFTVTTPIVRFFTLETVAEKAVLFKVCLNTQSSY